jgi:type IV secretion system protein VirD4
VDRVRGNPATTGFEIAVVAAGAVLLGSAGVVWAGACLAALLAGGRFSGGVGDALRAAGRLASEPGDPAAAWGELATDLPAPVVYWACTLVVAAAAGAASAGVWWMWRRWSSPRVSRFGVQVDAQEARPRDVRPLVVRSTLPPTGRMLLGRMAPRGPLLATEDRERHPAARRRGMARQGDRGSVALIGPTRSGKTVLASAAIVGWNGPVVALSVKRDLYDATAAARAERGQIAVFDPGGITGLATARWTPLRDVTTSSGALRAGRALAQAIPRNGVTGGDFWASHGETLTSAYMCLAGLSQLLGAARGRMRPLTIGRLASWAFAHVGATDPTVNELIRRGVANHQPLETRLLARDALTKLEAFDQEDPRIRASIYATARLAFQSWTEPSVAHSASLDPRAHYWSDEIWEHEPRYVDLDWLMGGPEGKANTLYLSAPSTEFDRLAPVLGGLLGDLREQIHAWDIAGRRLEKPLLIVIDEAGQLELQWLPEEVSTIAGLGGMFVTGWQSRSQIAHRYGTLADAVLGGHRSKVFFAGTDDPSTTDYLSKVAGLVHVPHRGWSADTWGGRKTVSEHEQREDLLPAHLVRQMRPQHAVLVHGTLPPVHLRLIRWWEDRQLRALVPVDSRGRPAPPADVATCPVSDHPPSGVEAVIDPDALEESLAQFPGPRPPRSGSPGASEGKRPVRPVPPGQTQLALGAEPERGDGVVVNRVAGQCERCGARVEVGAGQIVRMGTRDVLACRPTCPAHQTAGSST